MPTGRDRGTSIPSKAGLQTHVVQLVLALSLYSLTDNSPRAKGTQLSWQSGIIA